MAGTGSDWRTSGPSSTTRSCSGSLKNTLFLAFGFLVLTNVFGLLLALALNRNLKTRYLLRTLVFMPVVLAPIAVSYVWSFIFAFNGPLNQALGSRRPRLVAAGLAGRPDTRPSSAC